MSATGSPTLGDIIGIRPTRMEMQWVSNALRHTSTWSKQQQRFRRFGNWRMQLEWQKLPRRDFGLLMAVLNYYADEPFTVFDPARDQPLLIDDGTRVIADYDTLTVNGADQHARQLVCAGAPADTLLFRAGDLVAIAATNELYEVHADATSVGTALTLQLNQYIRTPPPHGAPLLVKCAPVLMWLQEPVVTQVEDGPPMWTVQAELLEAT